MKRRAVRLITGWLLQSGCPDWVLNGACQTLIEDDIAEWQAFLVVAERPDGEMTSVVWCRTIGVHYMVSVRCRKAGMTFWTVPVADILDGELHDQLLEYQCEPEQFELKHPAPVEATVRQS